MASHEECATALGEMSMVFQELENRLLELFSSVTDKHDLTVGLIIGSRFSFGKLCDTVGAIGRHRINDSELIEELFAILKNCAKFEEKRNTYVHSYYPAAHFEAGLEVFARSKHRVRRGKGFSTLYDSHEPEKLKELAFDMSTETRRIGEFLNWLRKDGIVPPVPADSPFL
jgi:hypothetical protein